jgi:hypothetical protein
MMKQMLTAKSIVHPFTSVVYKESQLVEHSHDSDSECVDECDAAHEYYVFALLEMHNSAVTATVLREHFFRLQNIYASTFRHYIREWMFSPLSEYDFLRYGRTRIIMFVPKC